MRPLTWTRRPSPLPKGEAQAFEDDRFIARIDNDSRAAEDLFVISIFGKLPGGNVFRRCQDYRDSYSEARALVRKRKGL